jgi:hypothetical protein
MAELGETFNPDEVEPRDDFSPVPEGTYAVEIVESSVEDNKKNTGRAAKFTLKITEGEFAERRIWCNINFRHDSEKAQKIGQQQLAELCAACGHRGPLDDTELLHGIPFKVRLKIRKQEGYDPQNEVSRFLAYNAASTPVRSAPAARAERPAAAPAAKEQPAAAAGGKRPSFMDRVKSRAPAATA